MNIKKLLVLAPVAVLSLTSCGKTGIRHSTDDYFVAARSGKYDPTINAGMNILQLSDLHLGTNCDRTVQYAFIQKTIDKANEYVKNRADSLKDKLDMIVITGDVFTFGTKEIAEDFVSFMEKQEIDWTLTFGNHDEQCYFSVDWLTGYLNDVSKKDGSHLLFKDNQDDDVFGNANFCITVPNSKIIKENDEERLYIFDSNRYRYQIGSYGYDYIHHDQIDWYDRMARNTYNGNGIIDDPSSKHSLAFFHIPFEEFDTYYKAAANGETDKAVFETDEEGGKELKTQKEGVSCPKENTHLFDKMFELGSTKGVFVGHDHINNSAVKVKAAGDIVLSFGVKGTDTVYADDDLVGGQVIHVFTNSESKKEIKIHPVLHKYADLEVK